MQEIIVASQNLPDNIEDLGKFAIIDREKLNSVRAEKRGGKKLGNVPDKSKICADCGRVLPLENFYKNGTYYRNKCKSCYNTKYGQTKTAKRSEQANDLYNTSKVIAYTEDNFLTDVNLIAEECIRQLSRTFAIHKDVAPSNFGDIVAKKFANIIFE